LEKGKIISQKFQQFSGIKLLTDKNLELMKEKGSQVIPSIINSSANVISNFAIMFYILYNLLKNGRETERFINKFIPLKSENILLLSSETKKMIKANGIGIPVLAIIQGIVATIGYAIFGISDYGVWGFLTGVCSLIPIVGTGIIWVPLTAYLFATNHQSVGIGLLIYAIVILTNIDYVVRLSLLKKMMDVHPLITLFGVIIGIGLFGFWGVIFGPLLISYCIILIKIYLAEFVYPQN